MDQTITVPRRYMQWIIAAAIAILFFIAGFFVGHMHSHAGMRGMAPRGMTGQYQGRRNMNAAGTGQMQAAPAGMASGTPAQMPMQPAQ